VQTAPVGVVSGADLAVRRDFRLPSEERMDLPALIERTADPAFACDQAGRMVAWNPAAEGLLGYPAESVLGRPCHGVIRGKDLFGNLYCREDCNLREMFRGEEPIHSFEFQVRNAAGEVIPVSCSVLTICDTPPCSEFSILHVLQAANHLNEASHLERISGNSGSSHGLHGVDDGTGVSDDPSGLTPREIGVLQLLASGYGTNEMAEFLHISAHTVRTHIRHVLRKLDAHSQLQAVTFAKRRHLI
jgi:PAS domain S-box-containing protein